MDIKTLAASQKTRLACERQRNREQFSFAAEMLDALNAGGITAKIIYAENAQGEKVGKRDEGPWIDGELIVRAAGWNARVYGKDEPQRDRVKRLRKEAT